MARKPSTAKVIPPPTRQTSSTAQKAAPARSRRIIGGGFAGPSVDVDALAREDLERSGIPFEQAEALGIEVLMPQESVAAGGWTYSPVPSLKFTYRDRNTGEPKMVNGKPFYRLRYLCKPSVPKGANGKREEAPKYLQPKDSGCHAFFPWNMKVRSDVTRRIIAEGEKKAIKGCMEGFPTIGLGGVNSYMSGNDLLPELADEVGQDNDIYLAFDTDISDKAAGNVARALQDLANRIIDLGNRVYRVTFPTINGGKCGLDDFLKAYGAKAFEALLAEAEPMTRVSINTTEDALALQFRDRYFEEVRFDHTMGKWFAWSGVAWRQDDTGKVFNLARGLCREVSEKLKLTGPDKKRLESLATARAVETLARSDPGLAVTSIIWDADPWLLGTPGGTVDLRTGELSPANPADHISRLTTVAPAATANCPRWLRFLSEATGDDQELIRFLQQYAGYCLTGDVRHHELIFIWGPGRNGKNVLLNTVSGIIGEYHKLAAMETFMSSHGNKHSTGIASLAGARLVTASETEEGRSWDEQLIKSATGDKEQTARFTHKDNFTFQRRYKIAIIGNHKPQLKSLDEAMKARMNMIPFVRRPKRPDLKLEEKLQAELPGILRWMIEGCLDWQKNGLIKPKVVLDATAAYFEEQDTIGLWFDDECVIDAAARTRTGRLVEDYNTWAFRKAVRKINPNKLIEWVKKHPELKIETASGRSFVIGMRRKVHSEWGD